MGSASWLNICIVSFGGCWAILMAVYKIREPYRHEMFKRKHAAYRLIHDTAGQLYFYGILCINKMDIYEECFETTRYNLMIDLFQNELLISDDVSKMAAAMANCSIEGIRTDRNRWKGQMYDLANRMRKELRVGFIHNMPIFMNNFNPLLMGRNQRHKAGGKENGNENVHAEPEPSFFREVRKRAHGVKGGKYSGQANKK